MVLLAGRYLLRPLFYEISRSGIGELFTMAALLVALSKRYRLNWIAWGGMGLGMALILFCIAWSAGSVLEGVPRAAAMGVVFFPLSQAVKYWKRIK